MSKNLLIHLCLISALLAGQADCTLLAQTRRVKFDEVFTLRPDESARTEDAKLRIRLKGVGRTISAGGEAEYAELQVRLEKSERLIVIGERGKRTETVGDYVIELVNAESFGKIHCELKISRPT